MSIATKKNAFLRDPARTRLMKISDEGTYLPFHGLSVVCQMLPSDSWTRLPDMLTAVAGCWISPLPSSSYHATLLAGPCQPKLGMNDQAWQQFLRDKFSMWVKLEQILSEASFSPKSLRYLKLRDLNRWGVCIDFLLEDPIESDLVAKLREVLRLNAETCAFEVRERSWHITLAYKRPAADKIPQNVVEQIRKLVETCILEPWILTPATLCYHPDMTAFVDLCSLSFWKAPEQNALRKSVGVHTRREEKHDEKSQADKEEKEERIEEVDSQPQGELQVSVVVKRCGRWRRS